MFPILVTFFFGYDAAHIQHRASRDDDLGTASVSPSLAITLASGPLQYVLPSHIVLRPCQPASPSPNLLC
ncbi:hypothetical protein CVT26_003943 [Gymnopilus dilepis]|uniref:Uncharacterized protein n=1 Tax=Gymnopilus dilepis TaxID=231916 RepID=A0A409WKF8_9AGAR|nr:hypothetical protein CVT26_003943 [Gymnopilus dilepis]